MERPSSLGCAVAGPLADEAITGAAWARRPLALAAASPKAPRARAVIGRRAGATDARGAPSPSRSVTNAAPSAIRRPMHEGQQPRDLQENATRSSSPQLRQQVRASARDRASSSSSNVVAASGGVAWACGAGGVASSWAGSGLEASPDAAGACSWGARRGTTSPRGGSCSSASGQGPATRARTDAAAGGAVVVPGSAGVVLAIQFSSSESTSSARAAQRAV
jgi:hypothetical protein